MILLYDNVINDLIMKHLESKQSPRRCHQEQSDLEPRKTVT